MDFLFVISSDGLDNDCFERFSNCLQALAHQTIGGEIRACIADYSSNSVLPRLDIPQELTTDYVHRPLNAPFNKPFCINYGYKHFECGKSDLFFFSDIDLVYPRGFAERLITKYGKLGDMVCATGLQFYQQPEHRLYCAEYAKARDTIHDDIRYEGGCLMISTALFEHLCGYDERYFGWGGEDDDFFMRAGRAGLFIVDESQELVHMYHPGDRRKQSANTERLNRRRRNRSDWFDARIYGEWEHRPLGADRKESILETGLAVRVPYSTAIVDGSGTRIRKLSARTDHKLSQQEFAAWLMADGQLTRERVVGAFQEQFNLNEEQASKQANKCLSHLKSENLLYVGASGDSSALIRLDVINLSLMSANLLNLFLWILGHRFDVVLIPGIGWEADITLYFDDGSTLPLQPTENSTGMNIAWSKGRYNPVKEFEFFDLVISDTLTSLEYQQKSLRVPRWLESFVWDSKDTEDGMLNAAILSSKRLRSSAQMVALYVNLENDTAQPAKEIVSLFDTIHRFDEFGTSLKPAQKLEIYRQFQFIFIKESALCGGVRDDLILAILAGAVPVYTGDPLANYEINGKRIIQMVPGQEAEVVSRIAALRENPDNFLAFVEQPLFYNNVIPANLMPKYIAIEVFRLWEKNNQRLAAAT